MWWPFKSLPAILKDITLEAQRKQRRDQELRIEDFVNNHFPQMYLEITKQALEKAKQGFCSLNYHLPPNFDAWHVRYLVGKLSEKGFNIAYPHNNLVTGEDGAHFFITISWA